MDKLTPVSALPKHPHDIPAEYLALALGSASRPDLLESLVEISRRAFGFYTRHYPHTLNYPWAAEKLERFTEGTRILDIGSGVSPIPLWLASRGVILDCVDSSEIVRVPPASVDWNEWGFFDYALLNNNIAAHHCSVHDFKPTGAYDAIYSISTLAHMFSGEWKNTLHLCGNWLRPGGTMLLGIDLLPNTDFLWNISSRVEMEPRSQHGTVSNVEDLLVGQGLVVRELKILRNVPYSRTDLLFIECVA
jgi:hypothetical protein